MLYLTEQDVESVLPMPDCIAAVEEAFRRQDLGAIINQPRRRLRVPNGILHCMEASDDDIGRMGLKVYTSFAPKVRFHVLLYDSTNGDLLAMIEADRLGQMRTGAATGVATKYMAREDAKTLGIFGAGWQAESQALAIAHVRKLDRVLVYSRTAEKRQSFADKLRAELGITCEAAESAEEVARNADIVVTATTSRTPVFNGEWLAPGVHVNAVGANSLGRAEIDIATVDRANRIVVDSIEQSKVEAGDFLAAYESRKFRWESAHELHEVVNGRFPGRESDHEITLFKSNGLALEDIATADLVYEKAVDRGLGREL
jgi:ornithine cyclodeaminase/alanine dehydrogenase-like protein (mu-crystallin family)